MLDDILIEDLAVSPPQIWRRRIKQAEVIGPLAALPRSRVPLIDQACADLDISRRQFFKLLKLHRHRLEGGPVRGNATGVHFRIDEAKEGVIAQAIASAGPAARYTDVLALAQQLARDQGIQSLSETSVLTRFSKPRAGIDLVNRLKLADCSFVADICPLELAVLDNDALTKAAWLIATIDTRTGEFVHHDLFAGKPVFGQALGSLGKALDGEGEASHDNRIGLTSSLCDLNLLSLSLLNGSTTVMASETRKLVGGSAIRAVCGRSLGRIPIRNEDSCWTGDLPPSVPIAAAKLVVAHVVTQMNSANYLARASSNMPRTSSTSS